MGHPVQYRNQICFYNFSTELIELNVHFVDLNLVTQQRSEDIIAVLNIKQALEAWLGLQSVTLTSLRLYSRMKIALPTLATLQKLEVFPGYLYGRDDEADPIEALDPTRYPSLKWLSVCSHDDLGRICTSPMRSVEALQLRGRCLFTNPSWKLTFPNLTSLSFQFNDDHSHEQIKSSIAFFLTHFPALVRLNLCVMYNNICLWNVLTGAAPRLNSVHDNAIAVQACPPEPLMNVIYEIPSLGNMKGSYWNWKS